jgi:hypothetical protein
MALWDLGEVRVLGRIEIYSQHDGGISAAFTPDSKQLLITSWGGHGELHPVTLWDVAKRHRLRGLDEDVNDTPFTALTVAPGGKTIALAGSQGRRAEGSPIVFWDLASGDEIGRIDRLVKVDQPRRQMSPGFHALAYSPDGRTLAALLEGRILLLEVATSKVRAELTYATAQPEQVDHYRASLGALAYSPDGQNLAVGCSDGTVRRFDLRSGREWVPLSGHKGAVAALCWTPDGKRIQSFGHDAQYLAWRAETGRDWQPKKGPLPEAALEGLWEVLRGDEPLDLFGSVQTLAASPAQTVSFLRKKLAAAPKVDTERIDRLVADLQKGDYNARKRAVVELRKIGRAALPALHKTQEMGGYDEFIRRLTYEFEMQAPPPDQVRVVRALRVLERIGDGEARKLLEELAGGSPEAMVTVQAKHILDRLGKVGPAAAEPTLDALWEALASDDSAVAYRAVRALASRPSDAATLRDRFKEVMSKDTFNDDPVRIGKLIGDLESKVFATRDKANKALLNLGVLAVPAMRKALEQQSDLEAKRRLEKLLEDSTKATPPPERLRIGRVLETLELMSELEGRQAIEALAKEARIKWLSEVLADSLRRQRDRK